MSLQRTAEARLRLNLAWLGARLLKEIGEHGRPNSFGVVELRGEYGGAPAAHFLYRIGRERIDWLRKVLNESNPMPDAWESLTYADGRFLIGGAP